jgi:hypothetical protein
MRSWLKKIVHTPDKWMKISGVFLLCALPVVTAGWAWGIAIKLGRRDAEELRLHCFRTIGEGFRKRGLVFLLMGFLDLCIVFLFAAALVTLIKSGVPLAAKIASALFFWIDLVLLCSGMYRYPLAVYNEDLAVSKIYTKSLLLVFSRPGQTFLFAMVFIAVFIISILGGLTIFLLFPGVSAVLSVYIYRDLVNEKTPEPLA